MLLLLLLLLLILCPSRLCVYEWIFIAHRARTIQSYMLFFSYVSYIFIIPLVQLIIDECLYLRAVDFSPIYIRVLQSTAYTIYMVHLCTWCMCVYTTLLHCHYDYFMINLIVEINNINRTQSKVDIKMGQVRKKHYRYWCRTTCQCTDRDRDWGPERKREIQMFVHGNSRNSRIYDIVCLFCYHHGWVLDDDVLLVLVDPRFFYTIKWHTHTVCFSIKCPLHKYYSKIWEICSFYFFSIWTTHQNWTHILESAKNFWNQIRGSQTVHHFDQKYTDWINMNGKSRLFFFFSVNFEEFTWSFQKSFTLFVMPLRTT